jgi:hypothetical protein
MLTRHTICYKYDLHIFVSVHLMTSHGINMTAEKFARVNQLQRLNLATSKHRMMVKNSLQ